MNYQNNKNTKYNGFEELLQNEIFLSNYNMFIAKSIAKSLKGYEECDLLDYGSGIGTLAKILKSQLFFKNIDCIEIDKQSIQKLNERKLHNYRCWKEIKNKTHAIYSSNVIEHIKNDQKTLNNFYKILENKGKLILILPAHHDFDKKVGHFRRYDKKDLIKKVKKSGFKINKCNYIDSIGFFATLSLKFTGYNAEESYIGSPSSLEFYDKYLLQISKLLDVMGMRYICGRSIYLEAEK